MRFSALLFVFFSVANFVFCDQEIWEKDMTNEIYIENANDGFEYVNLTCTAEKVTWSV